METSYSQTQWVDSTLERMTLEEKVGQLFVVDFVGVYSHKESENYVRVRELIEKFHVGGIILADGAVTDISIMMNEVQRLSKYPLIVCADLEAGLGFPRPWRFVKGRGPDLPKFISGGGSVFPGNMALGATNNDEYAYSVGKFTGEEARAVGIHWALAPVLDVNNNPKNPIINNRSFGEDPELVARLGAAFVRGCQDGGVVATAKHFPGHGDTSEDSHMKLPVLNFDLARLMSIELVPFKRAIETGIKSIMSAHIALPKLDRAQHPATLSGPILTDLLRMKLGFEGIIVTDGLTMQGITDHYGPAEAALRAIEAGADALLVPPDTEASFELILDAVRKGKITETRVDSSVKRILSAKAWLGLHTNRYVDLQRVVEKVGSPEGSELAKRISRDAITLLENNNQAIPIPRKKNLRIAVIVLSDVSGRDIGRDFVALLREKYSSVTTIRVNSSTPDTGVNEALTIARRSDLVLLPTYVSLGAWKGALRLPAPVKRFLRSVGATKKPTIAISFGDPYITAEMPRLSAILCAYSGARSMEEAAVEALRGEIDIKGKLPVSIPPRYQRGDGLELKKVVQP